MCCVLYCNAFYCIVPTAVAAVEAAAAAAVAAEAAEAEASGGCGGRLRTHFLSPLMLGNRGLKTFDFFSPLFLQGTIVIGRAIE